MITINKVKKLRTSKPYIKGGAAIKKAEQLFDESDQLSKILEREGFNRCYEKK